MRKRLFVRSAATLAVACLASAGVAVSAHADEGPAADTIAAEAPAQATGSGTAEIVVDLGEPPAATTPTEDSTAPEPAPAQDPVDPVVTPAPTPEIADPAPDRTPDGADATDLTDADGADPADAADAGAAPEADATESDSAGDVPAAADTTPADATPSDGADATTPDDATADPALVVPTVDEVSEAIDALPDHAAGESLSLAEAQTVAAQACGSAKEWCVGAGYVYATIQDAIDDAKSFGVTDVVIKVYSGTYDPITISTAIQIIVAEGEDVTIRSDGGAAVSVLADDVVIEGLTLECAESPSTTSGIATMGTSGLVIDGVTTTGCDTGVFLLGVEDTTITNSSFGGSPDGTGISGFGVENIEVSGNFFDGMGTGLELQSFSGATVRHNYFLDSITGATFADGQDVDFGGNHVWRSENFGVVVDGVDGFTAMRNSFAGNALASLLFKTPTGAHPSSRVLVRGNDFFGSGEWGIYFEAGSLSDTAIVHDNWFGDDESGWFADEFGTLDAALYVDEEVGGFVDATEDNYFGGCGPNAIDQGVDLGGLDVYGSAKVLGLDLSGCPPTPPAAAGPGASVPTIDLAAARAASYGPMLAETGADSVGVVTLLSGVIVLLGGALVVAARRRSA